MRQTFFNKAKRVVIKIGSSVIANDAKSSKGGSIFSSLAQDLARLKSKHPRLQVVLVSSGAIAMGMKLLKLKRRPLEISKLQALAALGQSKLMNAYANAFNDEGLYMGQMLLTWDDLANRKRYQNIQKTLEALLKENVIPIVNENDTVSTQEIEFGDNDQLSSMVGALFNADVLILLSDSNGFYADYKAGEDTRIPMVDDMSAKLFDHVLDTKKHHSKGGMTSKLGAIEKSLKTGTACLLANGQTPHVLSKIFEGKDIGTLFLPKLNRMTTKKHWIAYISKAEGVIHIDEGAVTALTQKGKSLLSKGINRVSGHFEAGSSITVKDMEGKILGKGIINFSSRDLDKILGLKSSEWEKALGRPCLDEVLHRDNFVGADI